MTGVPYHNNAAQLPKLFTAIQSIGIPPVVDTKLLASVGLKSGASYTLRILRALGLIDDAGVPTPRWKAYRDAKAAPKTLALWIREA